MLAARALNGRRGGKINLTYGNGTTVRVSSGLTVLEASLRNNIPVCTENLNSNVMVMEAAEHPV